MPYADPEKKRAYNRAYRAAHRDELVAYSRAYYVENRAELLSEQKISHATNRPRELARMKIYREKNRLRLIAHQKNYREANRAELSIKKTVYIRKRRRTDPEFKLLSNLRKRVWDSIVRDAGAKKSASTSKLLGSTIPEFRAHLESQFRPGMTWENYGPVWHIDHIKPCAKFDLLDPAQQRECFNFKNQQPLFAVENLAKGAR